MSWSVKQVLLAPFLILLRSQICSTRQGLNLLSRHSPGIPVCRGGREGKWYLLSEGGTYSQKMVLTLFALFIRRYCYFFQNRQPGSCFKNPYFNHYLLLCCYYLYRKIKALLTLVQKISQVLAPSSLVTQTKAKCKLLPVLKAVSLQCLVPTLALVFSPHSHVALPGFHRCPLH